MPDPEATRMTLTVFRNIRLANPLGRFAVDGHGQRHIPAHGLRPDSFAVGAVSAGAVVIDAPERSDMVGYICLVIPIPTF